MSAQGDIAGLITPVEYELLAAPALQAAAEVAAQRGDPHLYNDMPSMLALLGTVTALTHAYLQLDLPQGSSPRETLERAPLAVCALVFTESGLEAPLVEQCLRALSQAYLQLLKAGVLGPQEGLVEAGFQQLMAGDHPQGLQSLRQGSMAMAKAVDAWEAARMTPATPRKI
ncbi:MAG TPA: hypothetical protein VH327_06780 [Gammaproteobacteria bacterium]|nr:hypothetical protein [Gammaproteobacteria bacterium]